MFLGSTPQLFSYQSPPMTSQRRDIARILRDIEGTVGIDVFDEQIRRKVREEKARKAAPGWLLEVTRGCSLTL